MGLGAMLAGAVRSLGLHELRESELGQLRRFWGGPRRYARSRTRDCTRICLGATLAAAARSLGPQKYRRTGWVDYGGVEARRAGEPNYDN